ncbi:hypothetical protein GW17_00042971 [Ensete ventricosum]|nr:hypothetical protein GW17_00042971 [Ensete ventricosum]
MILYIPQMMSMGNGLCMSPAMLPGGMQHLRCPPVAHFAQMGMNMRFGYGMGMLNTNGSPGCPLVAAPPPMPGTQFPCSPLHGPQGLYGMPRPANLPMFAQVQALPVPVPRVPPPFKPMSGLPANLNSVPEASTTTTSNPSRAPDAEPSSSFKDQKANASALPSKSTGCVVRDQVSSSAYSRTLTELRMAPALTVEAVEQHALTTSRDVKSSASKPSLIVFRQAFEDRVVVAAMVLLSPDKFVLQHSIQELKEAVIPQEEMISEGLHGKKKSRKPDSL